MSLKAKCDGFGWPWLMPQSMQANVFNVGSQALANAADRIAQIGRVGVPNGGAWNGSLHKVRWANNSATFTGTVRTSVQGVTTSGVPGHPDGTIKGPTNNALATLALSGSPAATYREVTLNEDATVNIGDLIAIVLDLTAFTSGSLGIIGWGGQVNGATSLEAFTVRDPHTGTWGGSTVPPCVMLEDSAGNIASFEGCYWFGTFFNVGLLTTSTYSTVRTGAEQGVAHVPFMTYKARKLWVALRLTMDSTVKVYKGLPNSAALVSKTLAVGSSSVSSSIIGTVLDMGTELTLYRGQTYVIAITPSGTTSSNQIVILDVGNPAWRKLLPGGTCNSWVGRTGTTAFNQPAGYDQNIPMMGFIPSAFEDGIWTPRPRALIAGAA